MTKDPLFHKLSGMNRRRSLSAGAVQASVFATNSAIARNLFAKMFASAVKPDGEIVFGQAKFRCDLGKPASIKVNSLKQLPVLLRHGGEQTLEALAKQPLFAAGRQVGQFLLKPLQCSLARVTAAVEVNDGTAQNPVEPRHGFFLFGWLSGRSQRFYQTLLHHVFGEMRIANAAARERHEGLQVFKQRFFNVLHNEELRRATPARKAMTSPRAKINCNENRSCAFAWVNEDI